MSYSFPFKGTAGEIGQTFDQERDKCASYGMLVIEQSDINEARDFAMQFAENYGRVQGSVSGHWNLAYGELVEATADAPAHRPADPDASRFGRISITIDAAPNATTIALSGPGELSDVPTTVNLTTEIS